MDETEGADIFTGEIKRFRFHRSFFVSGRSPYDRLVRGPFTLDMIGTSLRWTLPDHEVKLVRWPEL